MKTLTKHITERLQLNKDRVRKHNYEYFPETKEELRKIIDEKLANHIDKKEVLNLNMIDTSQITDMEALFYDRFDNFKNVFKIDISDWNVSHVTTMKHMFYRCKTFRSIGDVSQWDVSNVTNMSGMFSQCVNLKSIDISTWNTKSLKTCSSMFFACRSIVDTGNLNSWNISQVINLSNMFDGCKKLKNIGDVSSWDVSNVTDITCMFLYCENLTSVGDIDKWEQKLPEKIHKMNAFYKSPLSASWYDINRNIGGNPWGP